ncbi:mucin-2-like [Patiria miniata]|uniref:Uncharacterized protein n=1 Tax=Patiria miniata TaxID=46514 RepID=A0A913Z4X5_PATMI|nr:mucin-2-like [Patiria miniata]
MSLVIPIVSVPVVEDVCLEDSQGSVSVTWDEITSAEGPPENITCTDSVGGQAVFPTGGSFGEGNHTVTCVLILPCGCIKVVEITFYVWVIPIVSVPVVEDACLEDSQGSVSVTWDEITSAEGPPENITCTDSVGGQAVSPTGGSFGEGNHTVTCVLILPCGCIKVVEITFYVWELPTVIVPVVEDQCIAESQGSVSVTWDEITVVGASHLNITCTDSVGGQEVSSTGGSFGVECHTVTCIVILPCGCVKEVTFTFYIWAIPRFDVPNVDDLYIAHGQASVPVTWDKVNATSTDGQAITCTDDAGGTSVTVTGGDFPAGSHNVTCTVTNDGNCTALAYFAFDVLDAPTTAAPTTTSITTTYQCEPTTAPEPTATPEPTTTTEPTITPELTTTKEPNTTQEPTTTPEPTLTPEPTTTPKPTTTPELTTTTVTTKPTTTVTTEPTPTVTTQPTTTVTTEPTTTVTTVPTTTVTTQPTTTVNTEPTTTVSTGPTTTVTTQPTTTVTTKPTTTVTTQPTTTVTTEPTTTVTTPTTTVTTEPTTTVTTQPTTTVTTEPTTTVTTEPTTAVTTGTTTCQCDGEPPVVTVPTVEDQCIYESQAPVSVTWDKVTATNIAAENISCSDSVGANVVSLTGGLFGVECHTVTCVFTLPCGCKIEESFYFSIEAIPVFTVPAVDDQYIAPGQASIPVQWDEVNATNSDGHAITCTDDAGGTNVTVTAGDFPAGSHNVNCTVTNDVTTEPTSSVSTEPTTSVSTEPTTSVSTEPTTTETTEPTTTVTREPTTTVTSETTTTVTTEPTTTVTTKPTTTVTSEPTTTVATQPTTTVTTEPTTTMTTEPTTTVTTGPTTTVPTQPTTTVITEPTTTAPPPTVNVPTVGLQCLAVDATTLSVTWTTVTAINAEGGNINCTDSGDGTGVTTSDGTFGAGSHTITCSVTLSEGCYGSNSFTFLVSATPIVHVPTVGSKCADVGASTASVTWPAVTATNAAGGSISCSDSGDGAGVTTTGGTFGVGSHTVTCIVTNSGNCTGSSSFTFVVAASPSVTVPSVGPQCTDEGYATVTVPWAAVTATNAAGANITCTDSGGGTGVTTSGGTFGLGSHKITCSVTNSNGCPGSKSFTFVVSASPSISVPVVPVSCTSPNQVTSTVSWSPVTGTNTNGQAIQCTSSALPVFLVGGNFPVGSHTITCTVTNSGGCMASKGFAVVVVESPSLAVPDVADQCTDFSVATATLSWPAVYGTNLGGQAISCSEGGIDVPLSGGIAFAVGAHTVICQVTNNGCSVSQSFSFTVRQSPILNLPIVDNRCAVSWWVYAQVSWPRVTATHSDNNQIVCIAWGISMPLTGGWWYLQDYTHVHTCAVTNNAGCTAVGAFDFYVFAKPRITVPLVTNQCTLPGHNDVVVSWPAVTGRYLDDQSISCTDQNGNGVPLSGGISFGVGSHTVTCGVTVEICSTSESFSFSVYEGNYVPFGTAVGDRRLSQEQQPRSLSSNKDLISRTISPPNFFPYCNELHEQIYFTDNGVIVFSNAQSLYKRGYPGTTKTFFRGPTKMIAPFWADVNSRRFSQTKNVFFQVYVGSGSTMLSTLSSIVSARYGSFTAAWALVITWRYVEALSPDKSRREGGSQSLHQAKHDKQ